MGSKIERPVKGSTISGSIALLLCGMPALASLNTPDAFLRFIYGAILVSSALTIYFWRRERRSEAKKGVAGVWLVIVSLILFGIFFVILPGL